MSKKNKKSKISSSTSEKDTFSLKKEKDSSEKEEKTSKVSANEVKIKPHSNGVRFTGPYRKEIPETVIQDLKTRDKEVIIDKKYLKFLVSGSYETIN